MYWKTSFNVAAEQRQLLTQCHDATTTARWRPKNCAIDSVVVHAFNATDVT